VDIEGAATMAIIARMAANKRAESRYGVIIEPLLVLMPGDDVARPGRETWGLATYP
jgi:hypothetical protein